MVKTLQNLFRNFLQVLSGLFSVFVLYTLVFTKLNKEASVFDFTGRIFICDYVSNLLLGIIVCLVVFLWFVIAGKKKKEEQESRIYISLLQVSSILLVMQIGLVYYTYFVAGNDVLNIRTGAVNFVNGVYDEFYNLRYFQMCPNNLMAYMIYILAYMFANLIGVNGNHVLIGITIVLANSAVLLSALTTLKLTNNIKVTWLVYFLSVALFGLSPWIGIPYTDMLSVAAPITTFYIYLVLRERTMIPILKWFLILVIPIITYGIKPLNIIILIAILICEILFWKRSKDAANNIVGCLIAILLCFLVLGSINALIKNYVGYVEDKDKSFGLAWVLFLGSDDKTYGQWSYDSYDFAIQYNSQNERQEKMLEKVVERISDMGVIGYVSHWMNKIHIFYDDAHFGWNTALHFVTDIPERNSEFSVFMRNIFYPPEEYNFSQNYPGYGLYFKEYSILKQFIWMVIFVYMVIGLSVPSNDKKILVLKTTWIGVFLFSMLFETHARIIISYLPMFCVMAGIGAAKGIEYERKDI